jgi:hypothetical protein
MNQEGKKQKRLSLFILQPSDFCLSLAALGIWLPEEQLMLRKISGLLLVAGFLGMIGCGASLKPVEGVVTLDGKAVEGATVVFIAEDGSGNTTSGLTDANGKFTLRAGTQKGVLAGNYKVLITKTRAVGAGGSAGMKPGSEEYLDLMKKKGNFRKSGGGPMAGAPPDTGGGTGSELPEKYATAEKTPLTCKVPPDTTPVKFELSSKP